MNRDKYNNLKLMGTAASDILGLTDCKIGLINTDEMNAAILNVTDKGECTVTHTFDDAKRSDFYERASEVIGVISAADLLELCKGSGKSFIRCLKNRSEYDEQLREGIYCSSLIKLYEDEYETGIEKLSNALKAVVDEVNIVLVGRSAVFYPVEHTVKKVFTPMPFLRLGNLYVNERLTDIDSLIQKGQEICQRFDLNRNSVRHNVMVRFKKLSENGITDHIYVLANKDESFENLKTPRFSEYVILHIQDPLVVFADTVQYNMSLPATVFEGGEAATTVAQIALGIDNDVPKLIIKSNNRCVMLDIDPKIYREE